MLNIKGKMSGGFDGEVRSHIKQSKLTALAFT